MKPSATYKKLQMKLRRLIEARDTGGERRRTEDELERQFMTAWRFMPDRLKLSHRLRHVVERFERKDGERVEGFDHCSYYTGENDQRIIVSQPYGFTATEIHDGLTLDKGISPEVIDATEWAFYYPGRANLFILKFPFGFKKAMEQYQKKAQRAAIKQALERSAERAESQSGRSRKTAAPRASGKSEKN